MPDDLEPFYGLYDWVEAFKQNPDLPVFAITEVERLRLYGVHITRPRPRVTTGQLQMLI